MGWNEWVRGVEIEPSIYAADFSRLGEQLKTLLDAGARIFQFDAGDGVVLPLLVGETAETGGAIAVQPDGRPVAAFAADPTKRLAVLRFLPSTEIAELSVTLAAT